MCRYLYVYFNIVGIIITDNRKLFLKNTSDVHILFCRNVNCIAKLKKKLEPEHLTFTDLGVIGHLTLISGLLSSPSQVPDGKSST